MLGRRARPTRAQLLRGVPVKNKLVRESARGARENEGRELQATVLRLTAPLKPSRMREMFGARVAEKSFDLDVLGAFVWESIDGKRTVEEVIRHFAQGQRVNLREAEVAVLAFLRTLTERGLVGLVVTP